MLRNSLLRLALTAVLLIPALGGSSLAYVCEMNGKIQRKCCCDHDAPDTSDCAELTRRGCCDLRPTGSEPITKSTKPVVSHGSPAAVALPSSFITLASLGVNRPPADRYDFATNGPPIFLRNCSLLH